MYKKLQDMKNKKGFTLVELIVVLVILAILIALLIPALTGYIDKANQKKVLAEARQIQMAAQTLGSEEYNTTGGDQTKWEDPTIPGTTNTTVAGLSEVKATADNCKIVWDKTSGKVLGIGYMSGGYTTTYSAANGTWSTPIKGTTVPAAPTA